MVTTPLACPRISYLRWAIRRGDVENSTSWSRELPFPDPGLWLGFNLLKTYKKLPDDQEVPEERERRESRRELKRKRKFAWLNATDRALASAHRCGRGKYTPFFAM